MSLFSVYCLLQYCKFFTARQFYIVTSSVLVFTVRIVFTEGICTLNDLVSIFVIKIQFSSKCFSVVMYEWTGWYLEDILLPILPQPANWYLESITLPWPLLPVNWYLEQIPLPPRNVWRNTIRTLHSSWKTFTG